jgi:hypothetical protein
MKNWKFGLTIVFMTKAIWASADEAKIPSFQKLKSKSSTAFECEFNFRSERTSEHFRGRVALTSVGELLLALKTNEGSVHECRLDVLEVDDGSTSLSGKMHLAGLRRKACVPALDENLKGRLNSTLEVRISRSEREKPVTKMTAKIAVIYLEGLRSCRVVRMNERLVEGVAKRLAANSGSRQDAGNLEEPLDLRSEQKRLKK